MATLAVCEWYVYATNLISVTFSLISYFRQRAGSTKDMQAPGVFIKIGTWEEKTLLIYTKENLHHKGQGLQRGKKQIKPNKQLR